MRRGKCRLARAPALRPLNRRRGKYTVDLSFFSLLSTLRSSRPPRPQSRRALPHPVAHAPRVHPATSRRLGRPGRGWPRQAKEALGRHAAQSGRPAVAVTHPRHRRSRVVPSAPAAGRPCGSWGRGGIGGAIGGARGGVCAADTALICSGSCVLRTSGAGHQGARGDTPLARLEHGVAAAAALGGIAAHRGSAGCAVWLPWRHPAGRWRGGRARAARRCCGSLAAWQGTLCLWTHGERSRSIKPPSIMRPRSPIPLSTLVSSSEMSYTASTASDETRYGRRRIGDEIGSTIDVVNALQRASEPHQRDRGPHFPPCPPPPAPTNPRASRGRRPRVAQLGAVGRAPVAQAAVLRLVARRSFALVGTLLYLLPPPAGQRSLQRRGTGGRRRTGRQGPGVKDQARRLAADRRWRAPSATPWSSSPRRQQSSHQVRPLPSSSAAPPRRCAPTRRRGVICQAIWAGGASGLMHSRGPRPKSRPGGLPGACLGASRAGASDARLFAALSAPRTELT